MLYNHHIFYFQNIFATHTEILLPLSNNFQVSLPLALVTSVTVSMNFPILDLGFLLGWQELRW